MNYSKKFYQLLVIIFSVNLAVAIFTIFRVYRIVPVLITWRVNFNFKGGFNIVFARMNFLFEPFYGEEQVSFLFNKGVFGGGALYPPPK